MLHKINLNIPSSFSSTGSLFQYFSINSNMVFSQTSSKHADDASVKSTKSVKSVKSVAKPVKTSETNVSVLRRDDE